MMEHEGISQLAARNHPFLVEFSIATPITGVYMKTMKHDGTNTSIMSSIF
jgi:hypothetical protein